MGSSVRTPRTSPSSCASARENIGHLAFPRAVGPNHPYALPLCKCKENIGHLALPRAVGPFHLCALPEHHGVFVQVKGKHWTPCLTTCGWSQSSVRTPRTSLCKENIGHLALIDCCLQRRSRATWLLSPTVSPLIESCTRFSLSLSCPDQVQSL